MKYEYPFKKGFFDAGFNEVLDLDKAVHFLYDLSNGFSDQCIDMINTWRKLRFFLYDSSVYSPDKLKVVRDGYGDWYYEEVNDEFGDTIPRPSNEEHCRNIEKANKELGTSIVNPEKLSMVDIIDYQLSLLNIDQFIDSSPEALMHDCVAKKYLMAKSEAVGCLDGDKKYNHDMVSPFFEITYCLYKELSVLCETYRGHFKNFPFYDKAFRGKKYGLRTVR